MSTSAQLFRGLSQADSIDLYRFMVHPILLGRGVRLFAENVDQAGKAAPWLRTADTGDKN